MKLIIGIGLAMVALMILVPLIQFILGLLFGLTVGLIKLAILAVVLIFVVGLVLRLLNRIAR